jgi:glyoxylase-like metal-dependent hydrolase (beta-lactamase superfamily II)
VNTHVHADHTGGNENFAKLGVTIIGRPKLLAQLVKAASGSEWSDTGAVSGCRSADPSVR